MTLLCSLYALGLNWEGWGLEASENFSLSCWWLILAGGCRLETSVQLHVDLSRWSLNMDCLGLSHSMMARFQEWVSQEKESQVSTILPFICLRSHAVSILLSSISPGPHTASSRLRGRGNRSYFLMGEGKVFKGHVGPEILLRSFLESTSCHRYLRSPKHPEEVK